MGFLSQILKEDKYDSDNQIVNVVESPEIDTVIGLPSWRGGLDPDTATCLDHLAYHNVLQNNKVAIIKATGSLIAANRDECIKAAMKHNAKWVLFIDSDMVFPPDALQRMQLHGKDVVSALAFTKSHPYMPNCYRKETKTGWVPIVKGLGSGRLIEADCVGGAFLLVRVDVLRQIEPPWFSQPPLKWLVIMEEVERLWNEPGVKRDKVCDHIVELYRKFKHLDTSIGEDYYFSEQLRRAGVKIHVDTGLKIGHIGTYMYKYEDFVDQLEQGAMDKYMNLNRGDSEDADG